MLVCCQKAESSPESNSDEKVDSSAMPFYDVGVVCKILRKVSLPDGA